MKARVGVLIAVLVVVVAGGVTASAASVHPVATTSADIAVATTPGAAGAVVSVPSGRIADSRLGLQIPGSVPALGFAAVQVAAPGGGVAAAVVSVTVVDPQRAGSLTVWPSGDPRLGTSNLTFRAGQSIAGTVVVAVGPDGRIQLFNGSPGAVDLIVDITGYTPSGRGVGGAVWAWGSGQDGQLGVGGTTDSPVPVPVFGLNQVTAVAGGDLAGYALRSDGTVWSWGFGAFGQRVCCAILSPVPSDSRVERCHRDRRPGRDRLCAPRRRHGVGLGRGRLR